MQDQPNDIAHGFCHCGCGKKTNLMRENSAPRGRVKGQPYRYLVGHNNRGMDRSKPRKAVRHTVEDRGYETPCWISTMARGHTGYAYISDRGRLRLAHRVAYEWQYGSIPDGLQIDHLCKVTSCVNPDHLEAVTAAVNSQRRSNTKLTPNAVRDIRARLERGETQESIAAIHGTSRTNVSLIKGRKRWVNV